MRSLIGLQLRKSRLTFAAIFGAMLVSAPLSLLFKARGITPAEAVDLAMVYWVLVGIPLTALLLSCIAGAEAAKEEARNTEQPLPVSQYRILLSSLAAAMLELAVLMLAVWAILGFRFPLGPISEPGTQIIDLYVFPVCYLVLCGFALSYAFRNGIAGAALSGPAVFCSVTPLIAIGIFQHMAFPMIPLPLVPLGALKPVVAVLALAGGLIALKLLSAISDRKVGWTAYNIAAVAALLAAPSLISLAALTRLNLAAGKVILPVTPAHAALYVADRYRYAFNDLPEASRLALVQKPFSGEVFLIDREGNRSVIDHGEKNGRLLSVYFFPDPSFGYAETMTAPSGEKWLLYMKSPRDHKILGGAMKTGFKVRAAVNNGWSMTLLSGKKPGILDRSGDAYRYSPLPEGKEGLKWEEAASRKDHAVSFLDEKYYREGYAAVFRKDGKTLEYRNMSWVIPGAAGAGGTVPGVRLADGLNFVVQAKNGSATYICRPGGKGIIVWPGYFIQPHNIRVTPDGTLWGIKRKTAEGAGSAGIKTGNPGPDEVYALAADGESYAAINTAGILEKTGTAYGEIEPLRARAGFLWFNAGDEYLVKAAARNTGDITAWRLPRASGVSATPEGVFITALDGMYFMDWAGNNKKIY